MVSPITQIWPGILTPHSFPSPTLPDPLHYANQVTIQICIIHALLAFALVRLSDFIK